MTTAAPTVATSADGRPTPVPWTMVFRWSAVATILLAFVVLRDAAQDGWNPVGLIQGGTTGPAAALIAEDFPRVQLPDGRGHDGQQFYAIAREPMHPTAAADALDRPRYRFQRILFPLAAWVLHPTGGGPGLVAAMFAVGLAATLAGCLATGALSATLGGPAWVAATFVLIPSSYMSLRIGLAETTAMALMVATLVLAERGRMLPAALCAVAAVLAKEPTILPLAAYGLVRRDRLGVVVAGAPVLVAGAWWAALRAVLPGSADVGEMALPFEGIVDSLRSEWLEGRERIAALTLVVALAVSVPCLIRRDVALRWKAALAALWLLVVLLDSIVLALDWNGPRAVGPIIALAVPICAALYLGRPSAALTSAPVARSSGP